MGAGAYGGILAAGVAHGGWLGDCAGDYQFAGSGYAGGIFHLLVGNGGDFAGVVSKDAAGAGAEHTVSPDGADDDTVATANDCGWDLGKKKK